MKSFLQFSFRTLFFCLSLISFFIKESYTMYGEENPSPEEAFFLRLKKAPATPTALSPGDTTKLIEGFKFLSPSDTAFLLMTAGFQVELSLDSPSRSTRYSEYTFEEDLIYCKETLESSMIFLTQTKEQIEIIEAKNPLQKSKTLEDYASRILIDTAGLIHSLMIQIAPFVESSMCLESQESTLRYSEEIREAFDLIILAQKAVEDQRALPFVKIQELIDTKKEDSPLEATRKQYQSILTFLEKIEEERHNIEDTLIKIKKYLESIFFNGSNMEIATIFQELLEENFSSISLPCKTRHSLVCKKKLTPLVIEHTTRKTIAFTNRRELLSILRGVDIKQVSEILSLMGFDTTLSTEVPLEKKEHLRATKKTLIKLYQQILQNYHLIMQQEEDYFFLKTLNIKSSLLEAQHFIHLLEIYIENIKEKKDTIVKQQLLLGKRLKALERQLSLTEANHKLLLQEREDSVHKEPEGKEVELINTIFKQSKEKATIETQIHQYREKIQNLILTRRDLESLLKELKEKIQATSIYTETLEERKSVWLLVKESFLKEGWNINLNIPEDFYQDFSKAIRATEKAAKKIRQFLKSKLIETEETLNASEDYVPFRRVEKFFLLCQEELKKYLKNHRAEI